jgi:anion-transporting  ArsA/GET3 family ATPase
VIVVDGPAAGHAISFLRSARSLPRHRSQRTDPDAGEEVLEMLSDPARSQVVLVTLPETTPVNEVIETAYSLEERVGVQLGPVVVNGVDDGPPLDVGASTPAPLAAAAEYRNARRALHRREVERLRESLAIDQLHLPDVVAAGLDADHIDTLAGALL